MSWFKKKEETEVKIYSPQITDHEHKSEEFIKEKMIWNLKNIFVAFWIFVLFTVIGISTGFFIINIISRVILWTVLVIIYAIILFFLLEPSKLREVERKETRTIEKEVIKEVEKPVYRDVIKTVEKPVIKEVVKEIEKPVYYTVKGPKRNVMKYEYVASALTGVYHKASCRLGKSIKKKYKEATNDLSEFMKKKYKPCKFCITKQVKV